MAQKKTKALELLTSNKTVKERAVVYSDRIKTTLNNKIIVSLEEKIENIEDKIFDLENFSLETNVNKGLKQLTKEDCQERFEQIIELSYEKDLLQAELDSKKATFIAYFGE